MYKSLTLAILSLLLCLNQAAGQQWRSVRNEVFGGVSGFQYFGDIGGSADESNWLGIKDIDIQSVRPGLYLGWRYQLVRRLHVKASYTGGILSKSDLGSKNAARNFAFTTYVNEVSAQAEFYIIPESSRNIHYTIMQLRSGLRQSRQPWSLYLFGGLSGLYYFATPRNNMEGSPRFNGSENLAMAIPLGIGVKYHYIQNFSFGFELGGRLTLTDHLDGFKPAASRFNDVYYSGSVVLTYKIRTLRASRVSPPSRRRWNF